MEENLNIFLNPMHRLQLDGWRLHMRTGIGGFLWLDKVSSWLIEPISNLRWFHYFIEISLGVTKASGQCQTGSPEWQKIHLL